MQKSKWFFLVVLICSFAVGCTYPSSDYSQKNLPDEVSDSMRFIEEHHYTVNYNFSVVADSVILETAPQDSDSVTIYKGDLIVVADFQVLPEDSIDSIYIKVARDQETFGWIRETQLLDKVTPDDPISEFIYLFSHTHLLWFLLLIGLAILNYLYRVSLRKPLQIVHFNDIDSPYPALLCILISVSAVFYGSIQHFVPETWVHFYYYPSLNPFELPLGLACFITCVWGILILMIAVLDEVFKKLSIGDSITYLIGLAAICVVCYIFFTFTTPYYIGYFFLILYIGFALSRCNSLSSYRCGACGSPIPQKKCKCPHCGVLNE